ncbi:MAG: argininosuccinate lyase, partial [Bacteroidetes bacterium]|nr:argininosuccinate lyase [Bacteroidota bacterium]
MKRATGRFRKPLDPAALRFSSSLHLDRRMYEEDIEGSLAHVAMLADRGVISKRDARDIARALREIREEIATGRFSLDVDRLARKRLAAEDVHMAIERRVIQKVGPRGGVLHTARSRNDQVALDERLFLRRQTGGIVNGIRALQKALIKKARQYRAV